MSTGRARRWRTAWYLATDTCEYRTIVWISELALSVLDGNANRTWEWQEDARLRGYAHPALFALLYKALAMLVRLMVPLKA
jgi:hypothetical protein